jgi:hypothetical protein
MFDFSYPKVKQSLGQAALQEPYPAWCLDPDGVIRATNLMAFWLWGTLRPDEEIRPDSLLGNSIFNILADNIKRIPVKHNTEFYRKRAAIVKRIAAKQESPLYSSFITAMNADPDLAYIYKHAIPHPEREWEYPLRITYPTRRDALELLEFRVTNYRLEGDVGFLITYTPTSTTLPIIEEQYNLLCKTHGSKVYMLPDNKDHRESSSPLARLRSSVRPYYPTLIQDALWYIIGDNRAHQLLVGESFAGKHFFEVFFAPQLRPWMGPLQETSAPRAIKYFETFTSNFLREEHELHAKYEQVMKYLLQIQDFCDMLAISRRMTIYLNLPEQPEAPFYTCRVILPWRLDYTLPLQFRSVVQLIHKGLLVQTDRPHYQVTLVPQNYETEVALILLHLASKEPKADNSANASPRQFLWFLTILKTVQEGLTQKNEGAQWEPETAFERIHNDLQAQFSQTAMNRTYGIIAAIRATIDMLEKERLVDREMLLTMLRSFMSTKTYGKKLIAFFTQESEVHTQ